MPPKPDEQRRRRNAPAHGETIRNRQAAVFEGTDWLRLATLAPIVEAYWRRPSAAELSEIRMNEERLGATVVDRMRIEDDAEPAP
ncbi:hypothetical protein [Actinoplanes xinjiangensis]|uniref:phage terminase small subunit n=1 Tax=Actinoplanes xinjiangensis TaxID=512350 RepID=UPI0034467C89